MSALATIGSVEPVKLTVANLIGQLECGRQTVHPITLCLPSTNAFCGLFINLEEYLEIYAGAPHALHTLNKKVFPKKKTNTFTL